MKSKIEFMGRLLEDKTKQYKDRPPELPDIVP